MFLEKKLSKIDTKEDIMKIFYIFRYYRFMSFSKEKLIKDVEELNDDMDSLSRRLITKACKLGFVKILCRVALYDRKGQW